MLDILRNLPYYKEVSLGQKDFILTHAGLGNFSSQKALSDYSLEELIFERPDLRCRYFSDKYMVFGHTPTRILRAELSDSSADEDNIYVCGKLIGIDCGRKLGCICLDTMEYFYV